MFLRFVLNVNYQQKRMERREWVCSALKPTEKSYLNEDFPI